MVSFKNAHIKTFKKLLFSLGKEGTDQNDLFVKWCQSRVELIDTVSGLYEDCIQFLDLMIEHGYEVGF